MSSSSSRPLPLCSGHSIEFNTGERMASSVDFPGSRGEPTGSDFRHHGPPSPSARRAPHLPFRRISMPSAPSATALAQIRTANLSANRVSVASQQSYDSLSENQRAPENLHHALSSSGAMVSPKPRRTKSRPSSLQPPPKATAVPGTAIKRRKVLRELLDTEKTYLYGLEFINEHFLSPLVQAATEGMPLISPGQMSSIFSNFVDMLGFHQSFYATLCAVLGPHVKSAQPPSAYVKTSPTRASIVSDHNNVETSPDIAALLAQHIPFLSMYTPFVTAYPTIMVSLHNLTSANSSSYSPAFALWLKEREQDPRCGRLGLRDWLLTLVQRCPRYLLLVRELVNCTETTDPEFAELEEVAKMLERINNSLNNSLQTQSTTLQLLAVQKATPNLPFPFLEPGRTFIRRGPLFQVADRVERLREFFLFSDYLVWLSKGGEREGATTAEEAQLKQSIVSSPSSASFAAISRGQSECETPLKRAASTTYGSKFPASSNTEEDRWWFRGKVDLLDLDIVLPVVGFGEEGKIEVHSPQISFSLFCDSSDDREGWASAIREAKQSRLIAMNSTNPNSTLASSTSNQHLRLALQALPYAPELEDSLTSPRKKGSKKEKERLKDKQRRGRVEHFVPAIWVPDSKAEACMRCGGVFGWRRRRHHCRLCGKCVCANCSGKTFFITSQNPSKESTKPARACNACYEAVFPILDPNTPDDPDPTTLPHYSSIGTLTALPFSKSTPSLTLGQITATAVHPQPLHYELPTPVKSQSQAESERPKSGLDFLPISRPRLPGSRPPSEIRLSSYTTSTTNSSAAAFEPTNNSSSATMSMLDSPSAARQPLNGEIRGRPRPRTSFSTPAVAVHTTPVTTRASIEGEGKSSRYSLVLGNKPRLSVDFMESENKENQVYNGRKSLDAGYAVGKLTYLLGRK